VCVCAHALLVLCIYHTYNTLLGVVYVLEHAIHRYALQRHDTPKRAQLPSFRPVSVVPKRLDGMEVYLDPGHIVLDGDPAAPRERGTAAPSLFSANIYCGYGRPSQLPLSSCSPIKAASSCAEIRKLR